MEQRKELKLYIKSSTKKNCFPQRSADALLCQACPDESQEWNDTNGTLDLLSSLGLGEGGKVVGEAKKRKSSRTPSGSHFRLADLPLGFFPASRPFLNDVLRLSLKILSIS